MRFTFIKDSLPEVLAIFGWNKAKQMLSSVVDATKNALDTTKNVVSDVFYSDSKLKVSKLIIYPAIRNTLINNKGLILSATASTVLMAALGLNARGRAFTDLFALSMYTINAAGIAFPVFVMGKCVKEAYAEIKRMIAEGVETYEEVNARYYEGKKNFGSLNRERLAKVIEYTDGNYWEWSDVSVAINNVAKSSLNFAHKVVKPGLNWVVKPSLNFVNDKVVKPSLNWVVKPSLNFANDKVVKPSLNLVGKLVPQKIKDTLSKYLNSVKEVEPYDAEEDMNELEEATKKLVLRDYFNAMPTNAEEAKKFNPSAYSANPLNTNIRPEYKTAQGHLLMSKFKGNPYYDNLINNSEEDESIASRVIRNRRGYSKALVPSSN